MKKQMKTLGLKKQTISALEARLVNGGAPTTLTMMTMQKGCISQQPCDPLPSDPRPDTAISKCVRCTSGSWNGGC